MLYYIKHNSFVVHMFYFFKTFKKPDTCLANFLMMFYILAFYIKISKKNNKKEVHGTMDTLIGLL